MNIWAIAIVAAIILVGLAFYLAVRAMRRADAELADDTEFQEMAAIYARYHPDEVQPLAPSD